MLTDTEWIDVQAIEAIAADVASFASMFTKLKSHPEAALLFPGLIPQASMFAVESCRFIGTLSPEIRKALSNISVDNLQQPRHRAKLLDDQYKSVEEVSDDLVKISEQQRKLFLEPHKGFLGPLKRIIQPDLGISTYAGHIFSTTHATAFNFGNLGYDAKSASSIGHQLGQYTASLIALFNIQLHPSFPTAVLPEKITMKDIKAKSLYRRGPLGMAPLSLATGLTFLLVNLNYVNYITRGLLIAGNLSLFRLKFISAFHANENLKVMQSRLTLSSSTPIETAKVLRDTLNTEDGKWLRKHTKLRNLLVHYSAEPKLAASLPKNAARKQAIEHLGNGLAYEEIDIRLDKYLAKTTNLLEAGFQLSSDPFWYGIVS